MRESRRRKKRENNGGYAIVLVIVAISLTMILVGVLLSISLLNYQMKTTEYKSKDNFYSAELILDQIHAGLQQEVSDAASSAYLKAMQTYKMPGINYDARLLTFRTEYTSLLTDALQDVTHPGRYYIGGDSTEWVETVPGSGQHVYSKGLMSYLDASLAQLYYNGKENGATVDVITVECAMSSGSDSIRFTANGLVLEDVRVSYTDASGYYSEIQTDIAIGIPDVALTEASVLPNVFEYAIIADDGLIFDNTVNTKITESVYAGTGAALVNPDKPGGVILKNSSVILDGVKYLVSSGTVSVTATSLLNMTDSSLWTKEITVADSGKINAYGDIYVEDDLTISGSGSNVKISGNYYGFGKDIRDDAGNLLEEVSAASQSAIIVNGKNSTLDLTGLDNLRLSGNAYIKTGNIDYIVGENFPSDHNRNILLGNSLSVKTDQIAFLAPAECLGTTPADILVGRNPMTEAEYLKWLEYQAQSEAGNLDGYQMLDENRTVSLLQRPLSDYFGTDTGIHYQTVFRSYGSETVCYVYLKMTEDQAAAYYRDYVAAASEKMSSYAKKYGNNILLNTYWTNMDTRGNLFSYNVNENKLQIVANNMTEGSQKLTGAEYANSKLQNSYSALLSKLTTNYAGLTEGELANRNVYTNLIRKDVVEALGSERKIYQSGTNKAVVTGGDITVNQSSDHVKLVIAGGDVHIKGNFSGLIIAGGEVIVDPSTGSEISSDKASVTKLLQVKLTEGDSMQALIEKYFINGSRYVFSDTSVNQTSYMDLESVIAFRNWTKR